VPRLPPSRSLSKLELLGGELPFSFFPMYHTGPRWGLHSMLYAADPWAVIDGVMNEAAMTLDEQTSAKSFVRQSREYFRAADQAGAFETKPLLYYYSFLNLGKAISIARGRANMIGKVTHGVGAVSTFAHTPAAAVLDFKRSGRTKPGVPEPSAFDELYWALEGVTIPAGQVPVRDLLAQSLIGHRMWVAATKRKERFFALDAIDWYSDPGLHEIWLTLSVKRSSLKSRRRGVTETLRESGLEPGFRAVVGASGLTPVHVFEQVSGTSYSHQPSDVVMSSVEGVRPHLWQTVTAAPPYRKFYLYLSNPGERRFPQWASVYATFFWLGSLTRYQPVELFNALNGPLGPFFQEFIATQPSQLLYLLTSEVKKQDVSKPAVV
jgi:hypothetical protein